MESVFYVEGARLAGSVKRGLGRSEILAGVEIDRLTPGIDPDGYHGRPNEINSLSLVHANHDCIAAQTQHKPLALGFQTQNDAMFVLQP